MNIWQSCPVDWDVELTYFPAMEKKTAATVLILPGGGYAMHAEYEGAGYAEFLNELGMDAFVLIYRVQPNRFPLPLNDARRAIRYIRSNAEKFGVEFIDELHRVIIHGVMHLVGFKDKTDEEAQVMRTQDNYWLERF